MNVVYCDNDVVVVMMMMMKMVVMMMMTKLYGAVVPKFVPP